MGAQKRWTVGLFAVATIALTVGIVGIATRPAANHVSLPTPISTSTTHPPTLGNVSVVTPSVVFPTTIPGCDTVVLGSSHSVAFMTASDVGYDNPKFPWFSGRKAVAMSDAARKALPTDVEIEFASPNQSLLFQPISNVPDNVAKLGFSGWTEATAGVIRGGKHGSIRVEVRESDAGPPPCTAGSLDRRIKRPDGTVIDVDDSWTEYDGRRLSTRSVRAYFPDSTQASVSVDDENSREPDASKRYSGQLPLSVDEAIRVVTSPELRIHSPIPAGTPQPPTDCDAAREDPGPDLDRTTVERVNTALDDLWRAKKFTPVLDRPLGSLQLGDYSRDIACEVLNIGPSGSLRVTISGGNQLPKIPSDYDPDRGDTQAHTSTLADGSIVQTSQSFAVETGTPSRMLILTRPSGTQILLELTSKNAELSDADLQTIASAPGLELR